MHSCRIRMAKPRYIEFRVLRMKMFSQIGREHVASILGKTLLGRADVLTSDVLELSLRVEPEPSPHPLHANIIAWPEEKSERKLLAMELAARAQLHLLQAS